MKALNSFQTNVFQINNQNFDQHALELFIFQYKNNSIYRDYVQYIQVNPFEVNEVSKIPCLPIQFFKSHQVKSGDFVPEHVFESSGTTGTTSKHYIQNLHFYQKISSQIFQTFFGPIHHSIVVGLLPSYLERDNSSLVYMVNHFIEESHNQQSGFYLNNQNTLKQNLELMDQNGLPIFLFGVTFALLEFAEKYMLDAKNLHIIETGGMKGRGRELIREELHQKLKSAFHTDHVFSEYGMTELLSQAYLLNDGLFHTPPWMRVMIRDIHDPFSLVENGKTGGINVIDLANVHSCAFIETEDLGMARPGGFNVLGRHDNSDLRGCNLLLS